MRPVERTHVDARRISRFTAALLAACCAHLAFGQSSAARWREYDRALRLENERSQARFEAEMADYRRRGDEQDRHIESLRRRLQQCGSCAERAALEAELAQIEQGRRAALKVFCSSFGMLEALNPAAVKLAEGLSGANAACKTFTEEQNKKFAAESARHQRRPYEEKARSGNGRDVWMLAQHYRKQEDDLQSACHYWNVAASKGYAPATVSFTRDCLLVSDHPEDVKRGSDLLRSCAEKGAPECSQAWAAYRSASSASPARAAAESPPTPAAEPPQAQADPPRTNEAPREPVRAPATRSPPQRSAQEVRCQQMADRLAVMRDRAAANPGDRGVQGAAENQERRYQTSCGS